MNQRLKKEFKRYFGTNDCNLMPSFLDCAHHFYNLVLEDILKWAEVQKGIWEDSHSCSNDDYDLGRQDSYVELISKIKEQYE